MKSQTSLMFMKNDTLKQTLFLKSVYIHIYLNFKLFLQKKKVLLCLQRASILL